MAKIEESYKKIGVGAASESKPTYFIKGAHLLQLHQTELYVQVGMTTISRRMCKF